MTLTRKHDHPNKHFKRIQEVPVPNSPVLVTLHRLLGCPCVELLLFLTLWSQRQSPPPPPFLGVPNAVQGHGHGRTLTLHLLSCSEKVVWALFVDEETEADGSELALASFLHFTSERKPTILHLLHFVEWKQGEDSLFPLRSQETEDKRH
jgi:hypothetical protein